MSNLIFIAILLFTSPTFGHGINISNGGDAIVCFYTVQDRIDQIDKFGYRDAKLISHAQTLDFWLLSETYGLTFSALRQLSLSERQNPHFKELDRAYKMMEAFSQASGEGSVFEKKPIPANWEETPEAKLKLSDYPDEQPLYSIPANCALQQAAIRVGNRYFFNPKVISLLRKSNLPDQVAILMLHEILAGVMREQNKLYTPRLLALFMRDFIWFLQKNHILYAWGSPEFRWDYFFSANPAARSRLKTLLNRTFNFEASGLR